MLRSDLHSRISAITFDCTMNEKETKISSFHLTLKQYSYGFKCSIEPWVLSSKKVCFSIWIILNASSKQSKTKQSALIAFYSQRKKESRKVENHRSNQNWVHSKSCCATPHQYCEILQWLRSVRRERIRQAESHRETRPTIRMQKLLASKAAVSVQPFNITNTFLLM